MMISGNYFAFIVLDVIKCFLLFYCLLGNTKGGAKDFYDKLWYLIIPLIKSIDLGINCNVEGFSELEIEYI